MRYRLTIEVDTSSGLKVGSSVLEYEYPNQSGLVYGQAPYVDLGGGRYIFALIDQLSAPWGAFRYCKPPVPRDDVPYSEFDFANDLRPFAILRREDLPTLVTFEDVHDPRTVREVSPDEIRRVTFQVVDRDEPLSLGFEEKFKWARDGNRTLSGDLLAKVADANSLAETMYANSFVWRRI